jgi:hypothetical protein
MKDFDGIILVIFGIFIICVLFIGAKTFLAKTLSTMPSNSVDSSKMVRDQKERMRSIQEQQRRHMDMQRQRIRDGSR